MKGAPASPAASGRAMRPHITQKSLMKLEGRFLQRIRQLTGTDRQLDSSPRSSTVSTFHLSVACGVMRINFACNIEFRFCGAM
jgi:hypothetical protein